MNEFELRMEDGSCVNCGERPSNDQDVLCDECREEMWLEQYRGDAL